MALEDIFRQPLSYVHQIVESLEDPLKVIVLEELVRLLKEEPDRFRTQNPNAVHNLAMEANRITRGDLSLEILEGGSLVFPDNMDLLADLLQDYYGKYHDPEKSEAVWLRMQQIPREVRGLYWRYWVFGALYHAKIKRDFSTAVGLLLEGVQCAAGDQKSDVLRNLEDVLIDSPPDPDFDRVLVELKNGIAAGYELGYTVAHRVAVLLQRRAASEAGRGELGNSKEKHQANLKEALDWLTLAESIFTNDRRHPITEIYRERVNILMGLGLYREAIEYTTALLGSDEEILVKDASLKAQFILACERHGDSKRWEDVVKPKWRERKETSDPKPPSSAPQASQNASETLGGK